MLNRNEDHQKITKAILDGNPDKAEAAMRSHVNKGNKALSKLDDDAFA
jgi:DNA-binding FadR family transcriptional regulator